jgi:Ca-activated chloride channel family protein
MTMHVDRLDLAEHVRAAEDSGLGCLRTERGNLPLTEIDVQATVTGLASRIQVTQAFHNPFPAPLEATYIFPLPARAAVTAMRMEADGRTVEGVLKEREQARAAYDQAISEGKRASIAEEDRPGVFTMRVGNVLPGERVTVHLELAGPLPYEDGAATFRFPLVVGPRYIPGSPLEGEQVGDGVEPDTDAVPDASRITPPVLLPGFPNPVRLSLAVDVDSAGLPLTGIASSLHVVAQQETGSGLRVQLNPGERADRDFILRLRYGAEEAINTSLAVLADDEGQGGTFALTVLPPATAATARPRDVVLVLDRSGSMDGWKMVAARRAAARILDTFTAADRLAVLAFDNVVDTPRDLPAGLVEATDRNRFRAVEFLATLQARGGTEMLRPLQQAAGLLTGTSERDRVLVLVTDGQVGNEDQILRELAPRLSGIRVHTVGVDRLVNDAFLQRLAGSTSGHCELVESEDRLDEAMRHIHRRIGSPLVTGLRVVPDGLAVDAGSLVPAPLPDLFHGAPVVISGRFTGPADGALTVTGDAGFTATAQAVASTNPSLAAVWARGRVRDLEDRYVIDGGEALAQQIVDTSLRFGVLSRFTAFVAVDQRVVNEGSVVHRVTQPVDAPSGWELPVASAPMAAGYAGMARPQGMPLGFGPGQSPGAQAEAGPVAAAASMWDLAEPQSPQPQRPGQRYHNLARKAAPPAPVPVTVQAFAAEQLQLLRDAAERDVLERDTLLVAMAQRITELVPQWADDEHRRRIEALATELTWGTTDPAEAERRWQHVITTLESLSEPTRRRSFWKR